MEEPYTYKLYIYTQQLHVSLINIGWKPKGYVKTVFVDIIRDLSTIEIIITVVAIFFIVRHIDITQ